MLVEIAIGDAYGAPFEFADRKFIADNNDLHGYKKRKTKWGTIAGDGKYTDDTQMSMALVEHILENRQHSPESFLESFKDVYKRDKAHQGRKGYSRRMVKVFDQTNKFTLENAGSHPSNGCVMRAIPIGMLPLEEIDRAVIANVFPTHANMQALRSTQIIALISYYFWNKMDKSYTMMREMQEYPINKALTWIENELELPIVDIVESYEGGELQCDAAKTVSVVTMILAENTSYSDILHASIEIGGDVDSIAAIALGLASLSDYYENDLPMKLYEDLENEEYGLSYLIDLDSKIQNKRPNS